MIQWPAAFCLTRSWMRAFFEPNNFIASLLSVGWKMFCNWFRTQPGLESLEKLNVWPPDSAPALDPGTSSSLGVPYSETSSFSELKCTLPWMLVACLMSPPAGFMSILTSPSFRTGTSRLLLRTPTRCMGDPRRSLVVGTSISGGSSDNRLLLSMLTEQVPVDPRVRGFFCL